jgi:hypothetical protein
MLKLLLLLNCWVMHPVERVSTNTLIETTVRNKYLYTFYLKMATDRGRNML